MSLRFTTSDGTLVAAEPLKAADGTAAELALLFVVSVHGSGQTSPSVFVATDDELRDMMAGANDGSAPCAGLSPVPRRLQLSDPGQLPSSRVPHVSIFSNHVSMTEAHTTAFASAPSVSSDDSIASSTAFDATLLQAKKDVTGDSQDSLSKSHRKRKASDVGKGEDGSPGSGSVKKSKAAESDAGTVSRFTNEAILAHGRPFSSSFAPALDPLARLAAAAAIAAAAASLPNPFLGATGMIQNPSILPPLGAMHPEATQQVMNDSQGGRKPVEDEVTDAVRQPAQELQGALQREMQWEDHFRNMITYKKEFGDCLVPLKSKTHPDLAQWVKRQRHQHMLRERGDRSSLNDDRLRKLDEIGFVWQAQEAGWQVRFKQLRAFQQEHGHCNVPTRYDMNKSLGSWVKCQRTQCRRFRRGESANISQERIDKLEAIGFAWDGRSG